MRCKMTKSWPKSNSLPRRQSYKHEFVETLPDTLDEGVLYICLRYATSAHNCFCGCGHEVVTPIHPTKWKLTFDGIHVSLSPSVGSWSLACKSHYWLQSGKVNWAGSLTAREIAAVRTKDISAQDSYFETPTELPEIKAVDTPSRPSLWKSVKSWLTGK